MKPHFGHTKSGHPVHLRTIDHHPDGTAYEKFNKAVAVWLTRHVGTMSCFWAFLLASLLVLPSVLFQMGAIGKHSLIPAFMLTFGFELLMTWLFSTCIQLILLPGLMVGQNLQSEAADARASKQFEDTEVIVDRLDTRTEGGLADVLAAVHASITMTGRVLDVLQPGAGAADRPATEAVEALRRPQEGGRM